MYVTAGALFHIAREAHQEISANSERKNRVLIAISFSAASLECLFNEISEIASLPSRTDISPQVEAYASMSRNIEAARGSVELKAELVHFVFTGRACDRGKPPYQDLSLLMDVRNAILHMKPLDKLELSETGQLIQRSPPILQKLRSKNLLEPHSADLIPGVWYDCLRPAETAKWSCRTANQIVLDVI